MTYRVEILNRTVWTEAPVFFTSRAEAEDYCEKRADKFTRINAQRIYRAASAWPCVTPSQSL